MLKRISEHALRKGVTPLEVMLDNMRFYHERAEGMMGKIEDQLAQVASMGVQSIEHREAVKALIGDFLTMRNHREKALENAVAAAPYCHPRLSAVAVSGSIVHRGELPEGISLAEAMQMLDANVRAFPSPVKQIEHRADEQKAA